MNNSSLVKDSPVAAFSGIRAGFARLVDLVADISWGMRCAREAERLSRLSDEELSRLGVQRHEIVQHAFRGYLGHY